MHSTHRGIRRLVGPLGLLSLVFMGCGPAPSTGDAEATPAIRDAPMPAEDADVIETVERFFQAMEERDPDLARSVMREDGQYFAMRPGAEPQLNRHADFIAGLEGPGRIVQERMWDPEVRVHGDIATLWTPYDLYIDGEFSHCGIDAFSLVRETGAWKVAGVIFTAEPEGCPRHPDGPPPAL